MSLVVRDITLHGHRIRLREYVPEFGTGEQSDTDVIVMLHGITGSGETWSLVLDELAKQGFPRRVIAPDLLGHGESAAPRADYGLGSFASLVRDVLLLGGHTHATVVGHSLGGGVAMQFAYQFPEMCGRLVLVDSGGFGAEVTFMLRATALPGTKPTLAVMMSRPAMTALRMTGRALKGRGGSGGRAVGEANEQRELARHFGSLTDRGRRRAFLAIAQGLIDLRGQRVSATERLYLSVHVPTQIVWGERDWIIPVGHGYRAASLIPGSHLEIFENARHFPHAADPERFTKLLMSFLDSTKPARLNRHEVRRLLESAAGNDTH